MTISTVLETNRYATMIKMIGDLNPGVTLIFCQFMYHEGDEVWLDVKNSYILGLNSLLHK